MGKQLRSHPKICPLPSHLLQVPWESPIGFGKILPGGGAQPVVGATEVGSTVQGGRGFPNLGEDLWGGGPGSSVVWVGGVGDDTANWESFEWITPQDSQ